MDREWWKESVVYQIYPRSFKDSNGDGIGDLGGVIEKLDYLAMLGIDVIWLSPIYLSSNDDAGYDTSDYRNILPEFGTMEDFDRLLAEAHSRGIRVMMDLTVNQTSEKHLYDLITVGKTSEATTVEAAAYACSSGKELNIVFQSDHVVLGNGVHGRWDSVPVSLMDLKKTLSKWQTEPQGKGWNSLYWSNHDQPRVVSRFGNDGPYLEQSAKMLATCLHMMQGTPFIYQGEELGMTNISFDRLEDYRDLDTLNAYEELVGSKALTHWEMMYGIYARCRDNARTPVQWDDSENAGFTVGTPWIGVNSNYHYINAARQVGDERSIFHYYKKLIWLRKQHPIIVYGSYELLQPEHEKLFVFTRTLENRKLLVICSFSPQEVDFVMPEEFKTAGCERELLISNYKARKGENDCILLRPYESRAYLIPVRF